MANIGANISDLEMNPSGKIFFAPTAHIQHCVTQFSTVQLCGPRSREMAPSGAASALAGSFSGGVAGGYARRHGAARRRQRRRCWFRRISASYGRLGRSARACAAAWAVCPRVCGGSSDAVFADKAVSDSFYGAQKKDSDRSSFSGLCVRLCVCHACF